MEAVEFVLYTKDQLNHYNSFLTMLSDYFDETFSNNPEDKIPKKYLPKILDTIGDNTKKYTVWSYLCIKNNEPIGFVMAQIDEIENPLCKREGWGFIREFYIIPTCRRKGFAQQMCKFIENVIYRNGAKDIYLTADPNLGIPFWEAMGYVYSGKIEDANGNRIYEKNIV